MHGRKQCLEKYRRGVAIMKGTALQRCSNVEVKLNAGASRCRCQQIKPANSARMLQNAFKGEGRVVAQPIFSTELRRQSRLAPLRRTTCMAAKVTGYIKLALNAGKASPAPPVGPALGSKGVNIMGFCKEYNAATQDKAGTVIPVEITVYDDRSFTFILKTPPASVLLKQAAGVPSGSGEPNSKNVGQISRQQLKEIAETKLPDLNAFKIEAAMNIVAGTAKNMGIKIAEE